MIKDCCSGRELLGSTVSILPSWQAPSDLTQHAVILQQHAFSINLSYHALGRLSPQLILGQQYDVHVVHAKAQAGLQSHDLGCEVEEDSSFAALRSRCCL